jgi:P pilus assembly chaperone PapD
MKNNIFLTFLFMLTTVSQETYADVTLDRTRIILDSSIHSISVTLENTNQKSPFLLQIWIEDEAGNKVHSPLVALPPLQKIEAGAKARAKIQMVTNNLPQNKESVFYLNVLEIPVKKDKGNFVQIAIKTRTKIFYRPTKLNASDTAFVFPSIDKISLIKNTDGRFEVINPGPYHITFVKARRGRDENSINDFNPIMIRPESKTLLDVDGNKLGAHPFLTYVSDDGDQIDAEFNCHENTCVLDGVSIPLSVK